MLLTLLGRWLQAGRWQRVGAPQDVPSSHVPSDHLGQLYGHAGSIGKYPSNLYATLEEIYFSVFEEVCIYT